MLYKPDVEEIRPRVEAWWRRELFDRACIAVRAPNGRQRREVAAPATARERQTNAAYLLDTAEAAMEATYYGGEAIPVWTHHLLPDGFSGCLGAPIEFAEDTSWAKPIIEDWDRPPTFEIDRESWMWRWYMDAYRLAAERAAGRFFVGAPDCHSGGDCLLAMRGGTRLCVDLYDRPDAIAAAMAKLARTVIDFHEGFWPLIEASGQRGHTTAWAEILSPGRSNVIQLDLLALISPRHFAEFFYHELEVQAEYLDNSIFHLDGPDAIKHLPRLYELMHSSQATAGGNRSGLVCIQWVYGAGNGPMTRWIDLLKDMQANGCNLQLSCEPREVETLMTELSSKGLWLSTWAGSREEADDLIRLVARLTHD